MRYILLLILGIIVGCLGINYTASHYGLPNFVQRDTVYVRDSIYIDSAKAPVINMPSEIIKPLDSITIDTINTIINGKVTDSKYRITIK